MLSVSGDIPYRIVQNSWGTTQEGTKVTLMKKIGDSDCGKYDLPSSLEIFYRYFMLFIILFSAFMGLYTV